MKTKIHERWIVDRKGKRRCGSQEFMESGLESFSNAILSAYEKGKYIEFEMYAVKAWHIALGLKGY